MEKTIQTLIPDIYELVRRKDGWANAVSQTLGNEVVGRVTRQFQAQKGPSLRLSQMGPTCPKALWHSIHTPGEAEALPPYAEIKYCYGHLIEALVIALAKATEHEVVGEQSEITLDGIVGHRDCVVDGCTVDVKSASSRGFQKFKDKSIANSDSFGYLDQLDGYVVGSSGDPLVKVKDRGYILAVDKTLGHMVIYEHRTREVQIRGRIQEYKRIIALPNPPACECGTVPVGTSGNIGLDVRASYSPWKYCCDPGIRTFLYANGPIYLTKVVRKPDVVEIDRFNKIVYN